MSFADFMSFPPEQNVHNEPHPYLASRLEKGFGVRFTSFMQLTELHNLNITHFRYDWRIDDYRLTEKAAMSYGRYCLSIKAAREEAR